MPDSLHGFRKTSQSVVATTTDSVWRYTDGRAQVSVIRYDVSPDVKVGADSQAWVAREGEKFIAVQNILRQRRTIDSYDVKLNKSYPVQPGARHMEHLVVVLNTSRGLRTVEAQYLWLIGGRWLKVRVTEPDDAATSSPAAVFAQTLARRVIAMTENRR